MALQDTDALGSLSWRWPTMRQVCETRSIPLSLLGHTILSVILCLFLSLHAELLAARSLSPIYYYPGQKNR